jgi:hypothetical protein
MSTRMHTALVTILIALGLSALPAPAHSQGVPVVDPSDSRLVPSPLDTSDPGTTWTCQLTGTEVRCAGTLNVTWQEQDGPDDWCSVPLFSVNGTFTRTQTRYYAYDASGDYLEYKRLVHLTSEESLTPDQDPASSNVVIGRLKMTWQSSFQTPGDLDSRVTRKQGIDTLIKRPDAGLVLLDVGQKTEDLTTAPGEDFDFRGRWDIALGDPAIEFGKLCHALGL